MKNLYFLTNKMKAKVLTVALCASFVAFSSCKEEEMDPFEDVTVQFQVKATQQVKIKAVVTQVGTEQFQDLKVNGTTYSSTPKIVNSAVGALHVAATATGFDTDSEMIVNILVNGEVKKTDTVQGSGSLVAKTYYNFID